MKVKAVSKRIGVSAIKAKVVADTVRGMNAQDAVGILTYVSKGAALPVRKVIESALANAKNNYNLDESTLVISEIRVDKGPIAKINAKRFETLGKGGYARFDRKYCHVTVVLDNKTADKVVTPIKKAAKSEAIVETAEVSETAIEVAPKKATKKAKAAKKE